MIFHSARAIAPPLLRARVPHRQQSAEGRRLLTDLCASVPAASPESEGRSSVSHSRGVVAAAISRGAAIGIDVEYMCPRRDMRAILKVFLGPMQIPVSLSAFYRAWTFGEAYFKAFGRLPGAEALTHVIEHHGDEGLYRLEFSESEGVGILHSKPFDDFALTIVWELADVASALDKTPIRILHGGFNRAGDVEIGHPSQLSLCRRQPVRF